MVAPTELADDGGGFIDLMNQSVEENEHKQLQSYRFRNEEGILAVSGVPVASVENADGFRVEGRERLEEADEAALVIELEVSE